MAEVRKRYYHIGEVAKHFNVNTSLIRFWEKEFDILKPKKNKKGNRLFTVKDFENLKVIFHLVKEKGFTLNGAKKTIQKNYKKTTNNISIINKLNKVRTFLVEMKKQL